MNYSLRAQRSISLTLILTLLLIALPALAQDAIPGDARNPEARTERQAERRAELEVKLQERIINLASNVSLRLTAATGRYGDIIARLETRIAKLKSLGVDTTAGEAKLAEAKELLVQTVLALENTGSVQDAMSGATPRESFKNIREQFLAVRENLRQVHALLREAVVLLKQAVAGAELGRGVSDAVRQDEDTPGEAEVEPTE